MTDYALKLFYKGTVARSDHRLAILILTPL